ncbi:MAG: ArsR family transcriptional regulator [Ktedonobacteraceae bacterium]
MPVLFSTRSAPGVFKLLANDLRWQLLTCLARSDYSGQDLVRLLNQPQNLVSYHLRKLREQLVVTEHRSTADERSIYYSLDLEALRSQYLSSAELLHPALSGRPAELPFPAGSLPRPSLRVLFLCTENSARSQMAEALLRHLSQGRIDACSAGSHPTHLHPLARQVLEAHHIPTEGLYAKPVDVFADQLFDRIITVCDRVREACPTFPNDPERIHWSFPDPVQVDGAVEQQYHAFEQTLLQLTMRIRLFMTVLERKPRPPWKRADR